MDARSSRPHGSVGDFARDPARAFEAVRGDTDRLCETLEVEDYGLQSMPDASPVKWHLAHTSWFFETFVLPDAEPFHPRFGYLFNSYYETVGRMHPRPERGLLSRPTVAEVRRYRSHVDALVLARLDSGALAPEQLATLELGLHHEQQHQELILTDLKHAFSKNAMHPVYRQRARSDTTSRPLRWIGHGGGIERVGFEGDGFHFDNEGPAHDVLLHPFEIADRKVTCGEYLEFMRDGGYERADLWLSAGWAAVNERAWRAPLYWEEREGQWWAFTLHGMHPVDPNEPVCHVSLFEADAYARWAGARLPTEFEWERSLGTEPIPREDATGHPRPADAGPQAFGDTWVWTSSAYAPFPGYQPPPGALGEYNGKFMCSQLVLRGGSCATPRGHVRSTYRNFFYPPDRWQFTGIQLARDP
ncbi:MAG: ergothioneine biosynthesis protein EgtB [Nannocystaceae bacterium]|nr:ergothioneine biosynthesis protein EgtB [bacterium]